MPAAARRSVRTRCARHTAAAPGASPTARRICLVLASACAGMTTSTTRAACGSLHERSLLRAAQHHDSRAREQLLERFRPLLDAAVHGLRLPDGLDREDVAQEARVAFLRAVARWRPERGPFAPFARTCVRNYLVNAIDRAGAHKHQILSQRPRSDRFDLGRLVAINTASSTASLAHFDPEPHRSSGSDADPEAVVLAREHLKALRIAMRSLTAWEQTAFKATLNGASHQQIALEHGVSVRAVTLAVRRARQKLARQTAWAHAA